MYKLIAVDLDETLLTTEKTVSEKNIEAIHKADALGVKIVVATGRGVFDVQDALEAIGFDQKEEEYVISFNGGAVTEAKDRKFLYTDGLPFEFANELYQRGITYDLGVQVYTKDTIYAYNYTEEERAYLEPQIQVNEIFEKDLEFLKDEEMIKILFVNTNQTYLRKVKADLGDLTSESDISFSSGRYMEFNHKGVNKGAAMKYLADRLGIDMSETIAIGDNYNDRAMFKVAGLAVGVQNMVEELRDEVDYITEASHEEDAVAEVIEKFILDQEK